MNIKIKIALATSIVLWSSAYVAIRAGLESYSPGSLALFRFLIASIFMLVIFLFRQKENSVSFVDRLCLIGIGAIGIGGYNIALNYGEISVPSGPACFIVCQSPIVTALLAFVFLKENLNALRVLGILISVIGVFLMSLSMTQHFHFEYGFYFVILACIVGGFYSVLQKPFTMKYHAIDVTAYVIWGGALALLFYFPHLPNEMLHASFKATFAVLYLGIFPACIAYLAWSYILSEVPASMATNFLYFCPLITTLLGWMLLGEVPLGLALLGGVIATFGVWVVNHSSQVDL